MRTALILPLALIGGCSIIDRIGNKPYAFPSESEPHAKVTVNHYSDSWFNIYNIDSNDCFAGTSSMGQSGKSYRIQANKDAYLALEQRSGNRFCRVIFMFTPEQNMNYIFSQGSLTKKNTGILGAIASPSSYCTVSGEKLLDSGETEPLALKKMKLLPKGLACLKMREVSKAK